MIQLPPTFEYIQPGRGVGGFDLVDIHVARQVNVQARQVPP